MDARLINSTTDLVALVPGLKSHGRYYIGPCPFCGGEDRFTIKRDGGNGGDLWICRKCGDGKYHDAVAFRMRAEGKGFKEVTSGSEREGEREPLPRSPAPRPQLGFATPPDEEWQISRLREQHLLAGNLWLADTSADALGSDFAQATKVVWHYLRAWRGLLPDTIHRYMIGYNVGWYKSEEGIRYPPGLHIPCMVDGQLWYVKVRLPRKLREETQWRGGMPPKYVALRGSREALFNANRLVGARGAVVVEGEFDAMLMGQFLPDGWAAVTMGSAGARPDATFLPYFSGLERVLLCLDNDPAGQASLAAWRGLLGWAEVAPSLGHGVKDFTDFWRAGGDIGQWLKQAGI